MMRKRHNGKEKGESGTLVSTSRKTDKHITGRCGSPLRSGSIAQHQHGSTLFHIPEKTVDDEANVKHFGDYLGETQARQSSTSGT